MRICYVGNIDCIHTQRWAKAFAELGHEVHVVYSSASPSSMLEMRKAGVSIHTLGRHIPQTTADDGQLPPGENRLGLHSARRQVYGCLPRGLAEVLSLYVIQVVRLRRLLRRIQPDIVHAWFLFDSGCMAALSGFRPLIVSSWGSDVALDVNAGRPQWVLKWANRYAVRKASLVTATSKCLAQQTALFAPAGREVHVVPFGVDCHQFHPGSKADNRDGILWLGFAKHLLPKYGPEYLIEAFGLLAPRYPHLRLKIAGEGYMLQELQALASDLGMQERVVFHGHIPHQEVPAFFASTDIAVMPTSSSESFGVAALEASATGVPVVASRIGGVPEVVVDGVTGVLVESKNAQALADALRMLIEDEALRERMGQAGREYVLSHYRWEDNVAQMAELYVDLVQR